MPVWAGWAQVLLPMKVRAEATAQAAGPTVHAAALVLRVVNGGRPCARGRAAYCLGNSPKQDGQSLQFAPRPYQRIVELVSPPPRCRAGSRMRLDRRATEQLQRRDHALAQLRGRIGLG
jgi:hypothetical protein